MIAIKRSIAALRAGMSKFMFFQSNDGHRFLLE